MYYPWLLFLVFRKGKVELAKVLWRQSVTQDWGLTSNINSRLSFSVSVSVRSSITEWFNLSVSMYQDMQHSTVCDRGLHLVFDTSFKYCYLAK